MMLLRVKSSVGLGAALLLSLLAACSPRDNPPNTPSAPSGPDTVTTLGHYYYSAQASDPDGDSIYFEFDLSIGSFSEAHWSDMVASGEQGSVELYWGWSGTGTYSLRDRAIDIHGRRSDWSPSLDILVRYP